MAQRCTGGPENKGEDTVGTQKSKTGRIPNGTDWDNPVFHMYRDGEGP